MGRSEAQEVNGCERRRAECRNVTLRNQRCAAVRRGRSIPNAACTLHDGRHKRPAAVTFRPAKAARPRRWWVWIAPARCGLALPRSPLPHRLAGNFDQRREQVFDNPPAAGLDRHRHRHARRQRHFASVDLDRVARRRQPRLEYEVGGRPCRWRQLAGIVALGGIGQALVCGVGGDCVAGNLVDPGVDRAVAREWKRVDFDDRIVSGLDEADVVVRDLGQDLRRCIGWNDGHQVLTGRHHLTNGRDRERLHDTVDRGAHRHAVDPHFGLHAVGRFFVG